jgi:hypothetical protein
MNLIFLHGVHSPAYRVPSRVLVIIHSGNLNNGMIGSS